MFPPISLWARLRIYAVRILIVASILDMIELILLFVASRGARDPGPYTEAVWGALFAVMPLHHGLAFVCCFTFNPLHSNEPGSALGPWKPLINLIDLALLITETVRKSSVSKRSKLSRRGCVLNV